MVRVDDTPRMDWVAGVRCKDCIASRAGNAIRRKRYEVQRDFSGYHSHAQGFHCHVVAAYIPRRYQDPKADVC